MTTPLLTQLNTTAAEVKGLSSHLCNRILNFLLRWQAWQEALDSLEPRELKRLVSRQDIQARALLGLGQIDASIMVLEARLQQKDGVAARNQLVRHYLAKSDGDHALALAQALVETARDYGPNWSLLGDVQVQRGDLAAAAAAFLHHHQLAPGSRQPLVGLMQVHHRRGDGVTAAAYAIRAYTVNDGESPLSILLLRELQAHFVATGDVNRSAAAAELLTQRFGEEVAELRQALVAEIGTTTALPPMTAPPPRGSRQTAVPTPLRQPAPPLPDLSTIAVNAAERITLLTAIQTLFGFTAFLPAQAEIMACSRRGEHVLAILPTGGGKSRCYQLLAFMEPGLTLVVSPLIALMQDQINNLPLSLRQRTIAIHGEMDGMALQKAIHDLRNGHYQLAYVTPERLRQRSFMQAMRQRGTTRLVIDEAHCVSVWGHDFRPDYLRLAEAHQALGAPPLMAMTATAPPLVRQDIERQLLGKAVPTNATATDAAAPMRLIATDIFRPNLQLHVTKVRGDDEKRQQLLHLCATLAGSGIVYVRTRRRCEEIAEMLQEQGVNAAAYHAGMIDRSAIQTQFMVGAIRVIVATIAFGMGIDKPDIRFVIHYGLPDTVEAYYQEIGRAGRDGQPAWCILLYSTSDKAMLTRHANAGMLQIDFLRDLYRALQQALPAHQPATIPFDTVQRALRCSDDTQIQVALSILEEVGALQRDYDAPRSLTLQRQNNQGDKAFRTFAQQIRLPLQQRVTRSFKEVVAASQIAPAALETQLQTWQQVGYLHYQADGRDLLLSLPPVSAEIAPRLESLLDQYAKIQQQHVTEMVDYANTRGCRHGYLANYLGGLPRHRCNGCDNCGANGLPVSGVKLPTATEQAQFILRALAERSWGKHNLIGLLRGDHTVGERAQTSSLFGKLSFRSENALAKLIEELITQAAITETTLAHGGVALGLTKQGRALCHADLTIDDKLNSAASADSQPPAR